MEDPEYSEIIASNDTDNGWDDDDLLDDLLDIELVTEDLSSRNNGRNSSEDEKKESYNEHLEDENVLDGGNFTEKNESKLKLAEDPVPASGFRLLGKSAAVIASHGILSNSFLSSPALHASESEKSCVPLSSSPNADIKKETMQNTSKLNEEKEEPIMEYHGGPLIDRLTRFFPTATRLDNAYMEEVDNKKTIEVEDGWGENEDELFDLDEDDLITSTDEKDVKQKLNELPNDDFPYNGFPIQKVGSFDKTDEEIESNGVDGNTDLSSEHQRDNGNFKDCGTDAIENDTQNHVVVEGRKEKKKSDESKLLPAVAPNKNEEFSVEEVDHSVDVVDDNGRDDDDFDVDQALENDDLSEDDMTTPVMVTTYPLKDTVETQNETFCETDNIDSKDLAHASSFIDRNELEIGKCTAQNVEDEVERNVVLSSQADENGMKHDRLRNTPREKRDFEQEAKPRSSALHDEEAKTEGTSTNINVDVQVIKESEVIEGFDKFNELVLDDSIAEQKYHEQSVVEKDQVLERDLDQIEMHTRGAASELELNHFDTMKEKDKIETDVEYANSSRHSKSFDQNELNLSTSDPVDTEVSPENEGWNEVVDELILDDALVDSKTKVHVNEHFDESTKTDLANDFMSRLVDVKDKNNSKVDENEEEKSDPDNTIDENIKNKESKFPECQDTILENEVTPDNSFLEQKMVCSASYVSSAGSYPSRKRKIGSSNASNMQGSSIMSETPSYYLDQLLPLEPVTTVTDSGKSVKIDYTKLLKNEIAKRLIMERELGSHLEQISVLKENLLEKQKHLYESEKSNAELENILQNQRDDMEKDVAALDIQLNNSLMQVDSLQQALATAENALREEVDKQKLELTQFHVLLKSKDEEKANMQVEYRNEISILKTSLEESKANLASSKVLSIQMDALKAKFASKNEYCEELIKKVESLQQTLTKTKLSLFDKSKEHEKEIQEMALQIHQKEEEKEQEKKLLKDDISTLTRKIEEFQESKTSTSELDKIQKELGTKSRECDVLNSKVSALELSLSEVEAKLFDGTKRFARKEKELETLKSKYDEEKQCAITIVQDQLREAQALNKRLTAEGDAVRLEVSSANNLLNGKNAVIEDLEKQINEFNLEKEKISARDDSSLNNSEHLQVELMSKSRQCDELSAKVTLLERSLSKAEADTFDETKKYARKVKEMESVIVRKEEENKSVINKLDKQLREAKECNEKLIAKDHAAQTEVKVREELSIKKDEHAKNLESKIEQLNFELKHSHAREKKAVLELESQHQIQLQDVKLKNEKLKNELSQQKKFIEEDSTVSNNEMKQLNLKLENEIEKLNTIINDYKRQSNEWQLRHENDHNVSKELSQKYESLVEEHDHLEIDFEELLVQMGLQKELAAEKIAEYEERISSLESQFELQVQLNTNLQCKLDNEHSLRAQQNLNQSQSVRNEDNLTIESLSNDHMLLVKELEEIKSKSGSKDIEIQHLREKNAKLTAQVDELEMTIDLIDEPQQNVDSLPKSDWEDRFHSVNRKLENQTKEMELLKNVLEKSAIDRSLITEDPPPENGTHDTNTGPSEEMESRYQDQIKILKQKDELIDKLQSTTQSMQNKITETDNELSSALQEKLESQKELQNTLKLYEEVKDELVQKRDQVDKMEVELLSSELELNAKVNNENNAAELDELKQILQGRDDEILELQLNYESMKSLLISTQKELAEHKLCDTGESHNTSTIDIVALQGAEILALKEKIRAIESSNVENENALQETTSLMMGMTSDLEVAHTIIESKEREIADLLDKIQDLESKLQNSQSFALDDISEAKTQDEAESVDFMREQIIHLANALEQAEIQRADAIDRIQLERKANADTIKRLKASVKRFYSTVSCSESSP